MDTPQAEPPPSGPPTKPKRVKGPRVTLTKNGKVVGRPRKPVNAKQVEALAKINCSTDEMAAVLGVSGDLLESRFAAVMKAGREKCKMSLKRKQYAVAMGGHPTMLIWLGKQMLGQRDQVSQELTGKDGGPIATVDVADIRGRIASRVAGLAARLGPSGNPVGTNGNGTNGAGV